MVTPCIMKVPYMLSVVIITLNEQNTISNLLNDLKQQTFQNFEVIIVDSNSDDDTIKVAKKFENDFRQFKIIKNEQRGASLGRNTGAKAAHYERLLFLDADTQLTPNFIKNALNIVTRQNIDVAGIYWNMKVGNLPNRLTAAIINLGFWVSKWIFPTLAGACIMSTKTAHNSIDGFNENTHIAEDCQYAVKISKNSAFKFRMIPLTFICDMRRFEQEGHFKILYDWGSTYLKRFFVGEKAAAQTNYQFGHHSRHK